MEYTIVSGADGLSVTRAVNELFKEGWELYGDLAVSGYENRDGDLCAQVLIKREKSEFGLA
jgi:hypothetical protein